LGATLGAGRLRANNFSNGCLWDWYPAGIKPGFQASYWLGKRVAIKGKFVFNTQEILRVIEEAEAEASKKKAKKRRTTKATTSEIEEEEEEDIEEDISESESSCIIVASSRSISK
jgi:hypothetical protein